MNKYVKELVEYYFHNEKKLYENTWYNSRHSFHLPYYRQLQYQYNNDDDMFNIVNEEYHISDVFDEFIDVLEDIYEDNIDILIVSSTVYISITIYQSCLRYEYLGLSVNSFLSCNNKSFIKE